MIVLTLERKLFNTTSENMANIFHRWIVEIVYPDPQGNDPSSRDCTSMIAKI